MAEIELRPTQMHWIENSDPFTDLCVHGGVYFAIDQYVVSDGTDVEWTVSTAAFNLLRTPTIDHPLIGKEALIPHCGFNMWPSESEPDGLYMPNCDLGINWSIKHEADRVIHEFKDGTQITTGLPEWKPEVCRFADKVWEFMHTAWPKVINDEQDREGFELFLSLWQKRRAEAELNHGGRAN